jgi:BirA family biotin operon repressor/biotin-[acetyl-CoA-carboxylase] ligase
MVEAAEEAAGLRAGALRLKWPNDVVALAPGGVPRKLAGVLGETVAEGDRVASAVVGIGLNADWPASEFPPELADGMTSLRELCGRPVDRELVLAGFLARLEPAYRALLEGAFNAADWTARQITTGARVEVELGDASLTGVGGGVNPESGALLLDRGGSRVVVGSGEVVRCSLVG